MFSSKNKKGSSGSISSIGFGWWNKINNSLTYNKFNSSKSSSLTPVTRKHQASRESYSSSSTYSSSLVSNLSSHTGKLSIEIPSSNSSGRSSCSSSSSSSSGSNSISIGGSKSRAFNCAKSSVANRIKCIKQNSFREANNSKFDIIDYLNVPTKLSNLTGSSRKSQVTVSKTRLDRNATTLETTINSRLSAQRNSSLLSRSLNRSLRIGSGEKRKDFRSNGSISSCGNTSKYYTARARQNHHRFGSSSLGRTSDSSSENLVKQFKQEVNRWLKGFTSNLYD